MNQPLQIESVATKEQAAVYAMWSQDIEGWFHPLVKTMPGANKIRPFDCTSRKAYGRLCYSTTIVIGRSDVIDISIALLQDIRSGSAYAKVGLDCRPGP